MLMDPGFDPDEWFFYSFTRDEKHPDSNVTHPAPTTDQSATDYDIDMSQAPDRMLLYNLLTPHEMAPEHSFIAMRGRGVAFPETCDDPFFAAHREGKKKEAAGIAEIENPSKFCHMDDPLSTMVCQDMVNICSSVTGYYTKWINPQYADVEADILLGPSYDDDDLESHSAYAVLSWGVSESTTYSVINNRGALALQVSNSLFAGQQTNLGPEQWKAEAEHWFRSSLALIQMYPHRLVHTPGLPLDRVENLAPEIPGLLLACNQIRFRSSGHMSLSFSGLLLVVVLTIALAMLSYLDVAVKKFRPDLLMHWEHSCYLYLFGHRKDDADGKYASFGCRRGGTSD